MFMTTISLALALTIPQNEPATVDAEAATGFLYKTITMDGEKYAYSVFVPPDYDPSKKWPVILFLHGSGERGTDGFQQTDTGLGQAIRKDYTRTPAVVVFPQCRPEQAFVGPMARLALLTVEKTANEYNLDAQRVYLTGLSLGGHGCWHIAAALPNTFAAVVPICGFAELKEDTGLAEKLAPHLTETPVWCFHGDQDDRVPVTRTRAMVAAIRKAGGEQIKYTEYDGAGHSIWDRAYAEEELWKWLFEQRRPSGANNAAQVP